MTSEAIIEADYIIWIINIEDGELAADSLEFIKNHIGKKPIAFIVNQADRKPMEKDRISVLNKIKDTLGKNEINADEIILYSSKNGKEIGENEFERILEKARGKIDKKCLRLEDELLKFLDNEKERYINIISEFGKKEKEKATEKELKKNEISEKEKVILKKIFDEIDRIEPLEYKILLTSEKTKEKVEKIKNIVSNNLINHSKVILEYGKGIKMIEKEESELNSK